MSSSAEQFGGEEVDGFIGAVPPDVAVDEEVMEFLARMVFVMPTPQGGGLQGFEAPCVPPEAAEPPPDFNKALEEGVIPPFGAHEDSLKARLPFPYVGQDIKK